MLDAVLPNLSPTAKFPVSREKNREFFEFRPLLTKCTSESFAPSVRYAQFSMDRNREFISQLSISA